MFDHYLLLLLDKLLRVRLAIASGRSASASAVEGSLSAPFSRNVIPIKTWDCKVYISLTKGVLGVESCLINISKVSEPSE
jgi:hypothetical protein